MTNKREFPTWFYEGALLLTTVVWGSSFIVLKGALDILPAAWLLALRFGLAAVVCTLLFWRQLRDNLDGSHLVAGALIGVSGGAAYLVQNIGLEVTTPGKNAFLTATYCVMVPFLYWIIGHKRPGVHNVVASLLCIVGVALIAMGGTQDAGFSGMLSFNEGDVLTLVAAFLFAVNIVLIAYFAPAHDVGTLTVVQLYVFAGLCAAVGLFTQPLPAASVFTSKLMAKLAYLVLVCTVFAIASQNFAQKHVEPSHASLLMSFESVFGVMFSVLIYHEVLTSAMLIGFAAIFISVLMSELMGEPGGEKRRELSS